MNHLTPTDVLSAFRNTRFASEAEQITSALSADWLHHGDWPKWQKALQQLPDQVESYDLGSEVPTLVLADTVDQTALRDSLQLLHPWRKGPWRFADLIIDSEWRSDLKWDRIQSANIKFGGKRVLDIGGGNGYFACRAASAGATEVLNVDPTLLFYAQFLAFTQHIMAPAVAMLPAPFEALPDLHPFNIIMSMGVLYHRRDPIAHLKSIRSRLAQHGQLVLETLIVDGDDTTVFVPPGRYARMRNVWFLPSVAALTRWLERSGFDDVVCHDVTATTSDEQRTTDWMTFESLAEALAPDDPTRTIEGHPGPQRALLTATVR